MLRKIPYLIKAGRFPVSRLIATALDNYGVYAINSVPRRGPLFMVWNVTKKCNLRCRFCGAWKDGSTGLRGNESLSLLESIGIVRNIADSGVWYLSICGGEPLLHGGVFGIMKEAKKRGLIVNISTNGLLLKECAKELADSGVDFVTVSIDGPDSEVVEKVRGSQELFRNIVDGITSLRTRCGRRVYIEARFMINKVNYKYMDPFVEIFKRRVDSIIFKPIYRNDNMSYTVPEDLSFSSADEYPFRSIYNSLLVKHRRFDNPYNRLIPDFLFNPKRVVGRYRCFAGTFFGSIGEDGGLYPCLEMSDCEKAGFGNLRDSPLTEIWRSDAMKAVRSRFKNGLSCDCWMDRYILNMQLKKMPRLK